MKPEKAVTGVRLPASLVLASLVLAGLILVGCEQTVKIEDILADPSRWAKKTVRIEGTVETSFGAVGRGGYTVSDGTGTIWVVSKSGVPSQGAWVIVEGQVFQGVQLGGQSYAVALREKRHRSR